MSRCQKDNHLWTARFTINGSLAFWFCQRCGETDRDVKNVQEPLEDVSRIADEDCQFTLEGDKPIMPMRCWKLPDGSILKDVEPASISFCGKSIPGITETHSYVLREASTGKVREFLPERERSSDLEGHFILTRYAVIGNKLIKYRISCRTDRETGEVEIDEPAAVSILFNLVLVE
ncbi:hypothetical protein CSA37_06655 [Candidatus Fermentibacteria bacterium]|nr:MAG: hypothetical protein CSA37_06655 [Candidatus Fermentibacteria bacterium]